MRQLRRREDSDHARRFFIERIGKPNLVTLSPCHLVTLPQQMFQDVHLQPFVVPLGAEGVHSGGVQGANQFEQMEEHLPAIRQVAASIFMPA